MTGDKILNYGYSCNLNTFEGDWKALATAMSNGERREP